MNYPLVALNIWWGFFWSPCFSFCKPVREAACWFYKTGVWFLLSGKSHVFLHQHAWVIAMFLCYFQDNLKRLACATDKCGGWTTERWFFQGLITFGQITLGLPMVSTVSCVSGSGWWQLLVAFRANLFDLMKCFSSVLCTSWTQQ